MINQNEMLAKAIILAAGKHADQFDKGGMPYILHSLKVMHYLKTDDLELMQIAVLHDVIEDTKTTYSELREAGFSFRVIAAVRALTKVPGQSEKEYMKGILANWDAMEVKLADLRHNSDIRRLKGVTEKDIKRIKKYHEMYLTIKSKMGI